MPGAEQMRHALRFMAVAYDCHVRRHLSHAVAPASLRVALDRTFRRRNAARIRRGCLYRSSATYSLHDAEAHCLLSSTLGGGMAR